MAKAKLTREEVAMVELGQTTISPATSWLLVVSLLLSVVAVPVVEHAISFANGETPVAWRIFTTAPSERAFFEFERDLEDSSVIGAAVLPRVQSLLVSVGAGNEQAYVGPDGWLFYRPGFDYVTGRGFLAPSVLRARRLGGKSWDQPPVPDPIAAIVSFRNQLAVRGIELLVMPTTVKPQLDPTGRSGAADLPLQNPSYGAWLEAMQAANVRVFDPAAVLLSCEQPFLKTDTHWTPEGMQAVAVALANELREQLSAVTEPIYQLQPSMHESLGDIATMMRLADEQTHFDSEQVLQYTVETVAGEPWQSDPSADVLVLGDSFSNIYSLASMGWGEHAGLVESLSLALQRPIDRITINDAGALQTRRALCDELRRGNDRLAGKKVVVWQFASRELAVGDWQILQLPEVAQEAVVRTPVTVRASVVARSSPPKPGSVPYKDCLIAVRLEGVEALEGVWPKSESSGPALLYVLGMRDNVWTDAATWGLGESLELKLVPWEQSAESVRSLNREELDDDELLLANPWYVHVR